MKSLSVVRLAANPLWGQFSSELMIDVEQAHRQVVAGKVDAAIAILTNILLKHQCPDLYRLLAKCYRTANEPEEAKVMEEMARRSEAAVT